MTAGTGSPFFRHGLSCLLISLALMMPQSASARPDPAPERLYGTEAVYEIRRNGTPVGAHEVRFQRQGRALEVTAESEIRIPFLMFTAYRFSYRSEALWRDGVLHRLEAWTDDDGDKMHVKARLEGDTFVSESAHGEERAPAPVFPTDHWHAGVLKTDLVLNTITGWFNRVEITKTGVEYVETGEGLRPAMRYEYGGALAVTSWYDVQGRWVGLRFSARDGSVIDYVCRRCGASPVFPEGS